MKKRRKGDEGEKGKPEFVRISPSAQTPSSIVSVFTSC